MSTTEGPWTPKPDRKVALHHSRPEWFTYESFYGLKEKPFGLSSDPAFFYSSRSHAAAFDELLSGIRRRESLSVLTGDIGAGKTTLCRTVLKGLDQETFSAFVTDPFATREDLLKVILVDFGVVSADDLATEGLRMASRTALSYLLYKFLATLSPVRAFAVVFIDEAQNLSPALIDEIRILSDSDGRDRHLQVVLVGQPELRDKLRLPDMQQVEQRVSVRCSLRPLDRDGVAGYIAHRLHVAGGTPDRVRFAHEAIDLAYVASGGVPRLLNRLCDRALHHGHARHAAVIDRQTFALACVEAELGHRAPAPPPPTAESLPKPFPVDSDEAWFEEVDAHVIRPDEADTANAREIDEARVLPMPPRRARRTTVPLTRMEILRRAWMRWMRVGMR